MRKNNNKQSNKRKSKNRLGNNNMALYKSVPILNSSLNKRINIQYPIYAVYNTSGATAFYSYTASTSGAILYKDLYNDVLSSTEYTSFYQQYNFVKVSAIDLQVVPTFTNSVSLTDLPPVFFNLLTGVASGPANTFAVARADNSMEVKMNSAGDRPTIRRFVFPKVLQGLGGYTLGGTDTWIASTSLASAAFMYVVLGYLQPPAFTVATNTAIRVGILDCFVNVTFAGASYSN